MWKGAFRVESRTIVVDFRLEEVVGGNFRHGICETFWEDWSSSG